MAKKQETPSAPAEATEAPVMATTAPETPTAEALPLEGQAVTNETKTSWACPKDGTEMAPMGRRSGAWRCPACKAVFLDVEAMRRGPMGKQPVWTRAVLNVAMAVIVTVVARRFLRRIKG